jgi:hypothetical protein
VSQLNDFVASHLGVIGVVIGVGCIVLLLMVLMLFIQSRRIALLSERLDSLTQGADGQSLEEVLGTHLDTVMGVAHALDEVIARTAVLEGGARMHFGRLGLVRFNPFDDTGGNQSFVLAMLDANNDGFVMSSLHSRTVTRLYAKAIFGGGSEMTLSAEETQAVEIAVSQGGVAPVRGKAAAGGLGGSAARGAGRERVAPSASVADRASGDANRSPDVEPAGAVAAESEPQPAESEPQLAEADQTAPPA